MSGPPVFPPPAPSPLEKKLLSYLDELQVARLRVKELEKENELLRRQVGISSEGQENAELLARFPFYAGLSRSQKNIFRLLVRNLGKTVQYKDLLFSLHGDDIKPDQNMNGLRVATSWLRTKMKISASKLLLLNDYGNGYVLVPEGHEVSVSVRGRVGRELVRVKN